MYYYDACILVGCLHASRMLVNSSPVDWAEPLYDSDFIPLGPERELFMAALPRGPFVASHQQIAAPRRAAAQQP